MSVWPIIAPLDPRLNIANKALLDKGEEGRITSFFADLKAEPNDNSGLNSQILFGENVTIFDVKDGWTRVQSVRDNYVGWTQSANVGVGFNTATHVVLVPRTFLYPQPDMKLPRVGYRSLGSLVEVVGAAETRGTKYNILADGEAVVASHLSPINSYEPDYVSVAETLLHTPYLWGGVTAFGIDCSGLVQLSMRMAGIDVLRDSDMQAATIGSPIEANENWSNLKRGDLIFWKGHIGICQGVKYSKQYLLHANGHTMSVASEPLGEAIKRIEHLYQAPIGVRRPKAIGA